MNTNKAYFAAEEHSEYLYVIATAVKSRRLIRAGESYELAAKPVRKNRSASRIRKSKCAKTRYRDHREAELALHKIQVKKQWFEQDGLECRRMESRIYFHGECKGFHLTSQNYDNGGVRNNVDEAA